MPVTMSVCLQPSMVLKKYTYLPLPHVYCHSHMSLRHSSALKVVEEDVRVVHRTEATGSWRKNSIACLSPVPALEPFLPPSARRYLPFEAFLRATTFGLSPASMIHFSSSPLSPRFDATTPEGLEFGWLARMRPFDTLVT